MARAQERPRPLSEVGRDPDPRVSFANERTMLAWIRTALALIATGIGVIHLLPSFPVPGGRRLVGIPLIALGGVMALTSHQRWERRERALRLGEGLPPTRFPMIVAYGVAVIAVVVAILSGSIQGD